MGRIRNEEGTRTRSSDEHSVGEAKEVEEQVGNNE